MYVKFGYKMPDYLAPGESTPIYLDMANDADYKVRFYVDFYYSTDKGATWKKFAHDEWPLDAGKSYTNLRTLTKFTMPSASEAILSLTWRARKIHTDGTIGEEVGSGDDYHTIKQSGVTHEVGCTREEFRNTMVSWYKDKAIGWCDAYSPILDKTYEVKQVYPNVTKATLTIYGSNLKEIRIKGPYDTKPSEFSTKEKLTNWGRDQEWERQYCERDKKWYWVIYPCKIDIEPKIIEVYIGKRLVVDVEPKVVAPGEPVKITWYHKTNLRRTQFKIYVYLDDSLIKKYEFSQSWADGIKSESFTHPAPTTPGIHTVKVVLWRHEIPVREERKVAEYSTTFEVRRVHKVEPETKIANVAVIEPNGQVHSITESNKTATVTSQPVKVIVTLSNESEEPRKLIAELIVNDSSKGIKTTDVSAGGVSTVSWDNVQLQSGSNTFTVRVGH